MSRSRLGHDWRKSQAHLLLLSKFLHAATAGETAWAPGWKKALRETSEQAIMRFVEEGVLVPAGRSSRMAYLTYKYTVSTLQAKLEQRGLPVSGRRADLISRLIEADPEGTEGAVDDLSVLELSPRGRAIVSEYFAAVQEDRETAEQEVIAKLQKRQFREACLAYYGYQARQVFPSGGSKQWENRNPTKDAVALESIYRSNPRILARLNESQLALLRMATGMMILWGNGVECWLPAGFQTGLAMDASTAAQMLLIHGEYRATLKLFRRYDIEVVEILVTNDDRTCEACCELVGKTFALNEAPELPHERCTSEVGCRCAASPVPAV